MDTPAMVIGKVAAILLILIAVAVYAVLPVVNFVDNETSNKTAAIFGASSLEASSITPTSAFGNVVNVLPIALVVFSVMFIIFNYIMNENERRRKRAAAMKYRPIINIRGA